MALDCIARYQRRMARLQLLGHPGLALDRADVVERIGAHGKACRLHVAFPSAAAAAAAVLVDHQLRARLCARRERDKGGSDKCFQHRASGIHDGMIPPPAARSLTEVKGMIG